MSQHTLLSETIERAAKQVSSSSAAAYQRNMIRFVDFLESEVNWSAKIPKDVLTNWLPFVEKEQEDKISAWNCNPKLPTPILNEVTLEICEKFTDQNASEKSRKSVRSAINKLMLQAGSDGDIPSSVIEPLNIKENAGGNQKRKTIGTSDVRRLRASLLSNDHAPISLRTLVCVDLMLYMGFRQKDIIRLTLGDITVKNEAMWLQTGGLKIKANAVVQDTIEKYVAVTDRVLGESDPLSALIVSEGGKGITDRSLRYIFQSLFGGDFSAYDTGSLRRTCAINALENGATIPMVQAMLRIKDSKTLGSYLGINVDEIRLPYVASYVKYD